MGESGWEKLGRGWAANKSKDAVANFRNASVERRSGGKLDWREGKEEGFGRDSHYFRGTNSRK